MKIQTTYVPTDSDNKPFTLPGVYTLKDIQKLGADLVGAGVSPFDTMSISINRDGWLTITVEKTLEAPKEDQPA